MYPLLETIRIARIRPENLEGHQQRMDASYKELFNKHNPFSLKDIINLPQHLSPEKVYKCRVVYGETNYKITYSEYTAPHVRTLKLVHSHHLDYHLKYADRNILNKLKNSHPTFDDVLIVKNGLITDTSFSNIALLSYSRWHTPAVPLLNGTQRQALLREGLLISTHIRPEDLFRYQGFRLINAMRPFKSQPVQPISNIFP